MYVLAEPSMAAWLAHPAPSCIVDVPLALSPFGLWAVLGLAREMPTWLPRALWNVLDDLPFYLNRDEVTAGLGLGHAGPSSRAEGLTAAAAHWREARISLDLAALARVYWPADTAERSIIPEGCEPGLVPRLDALTAGLDQRRKPGAVGNVDLLADCVRDTLALAAVLDGERPIVLTLLRVGETAPMLTAFCREWGIGCRRARPGAATRAIRATLLPVLARTGLASLVSADVIRLVGLKLIVPHGPFVASSEAKIDDAVELGCSSLAEGSEARLWDNAIAIWSELP